MLFTRCIASRETKKTGTEETGSVNLLSARLLPAVLLLVGLLLAPMVLSGCQSTGETGAAGEVSSADQGYATADANTVSIPEEKRQQPLEFSGESDRGGRIGSEDLKGSVAVVNLWFAGCPPCRAEISDFVKAHKELAPEGVKFLGVNTRDNTAQALQFEEQFKVPYASIVDSLEDSGAQRAMAQQVPLNAVPTTIILDAQGRVAHRIVGQIAGVSQLRTLVKETLAEGSK